MKFFERPLAFFPLVIALISIMIFGIAFGSGLTVFAQGGDVVTTTADVEVAAPDSSDVFDSPVDPPGEKPEPAPIDPAPPFSELLIRIIEQLGETLTGAVIGAIGVAQLYVVSLVRRLFPNSDKTATAINGGVAQLTAVLSSIVLALITYGVSYLIGLAGSADIVSLSGLATTIFIGGLGIHKVNKISTFTRALKIIAASNTPTTR